MLLIHNNIFFKKLFFIKTYLINNLKKYWFFLSFFFILLIGVNSLWPRLELQQDFTLHDKFFHFLAYLSLSSPVSIARPKNHKFILLFFIFYGGLIEVIQPFVNRSMDIFDFFANCMGVYFAYKFINKLS